LRVFVSFAEEDVQNVTPVIATLASWQITCWAPVRDPQNPENDMSIQRGLPHADVFLRVCTGNTLRSYWMTMEQTAFHNAQAEEFRQTGQLRHRMINLILDEKYQRQPFDYADPIIDASDRNTSWQQQLYAAIFGQGHLLDPQAL
jgi:hypothetical protein